MDYSPEFVEFEEDEEDDVEEEVSPKVPKVNVDSMIAVQEGKSAKSKARSTYWNYAAIGIRNEYLDHKEFANPFTLRECLDHKDRLLAWLEEFLPQVKNYRVYIGKTACRKGYCLKMIIGEEGSLYAMAMQGYTVIVVNTSLAAGSKDSKRVEALGLHIIELRKKLQDPGKAYHEDYANVRIERLPLGDGRTEEELQIAKLVAADDAGYPIIWSTPGPLPEACHPYQSADRYVRIRIQADHLVAFDVNEEKKRLVPRCQVDKREKTKGGKLQKAPMNATDQSSTGKRKYTKGPYLCQVCGREFAKSARLNRHVATHAEGKSYLCDVCGLTFKTPYSLREHADRHKQRRFPCPECGKTYAKKFNLEEHRRLHDPSAPKYTCETCSKTFHSANHLKNHNKIHQPKQNASVKAIHYYNCDLCTLRYMSKKGLRKHNSKHHAKENEK